MPCTAPTPSKPRARKLRISSRNCKFIRASQSNLECAAQSPPMSAVNLLDFDADGLERFFAGMSEPAFRARQVLRWVHRNGESDFAAMSDLAKSLREKLGRDASVAVPRVVSDKTASD